MFVVCTSIRQQQQQQMIISLSISMAKSPLHYFTSYLCVSIYTVRIPLGQCKSEEKKNKTKNNTIAIKCVISIHMNFLIFPLASIYDLLLFYFFLVVQAVAIFGHRPPQTPLLNYFECLCFWKNQTVKPVEL